MPRATRSRLRTYRRRGAHFHTEPEPLVADFGFVPDRGIAKWRWVVRLGIPGDNWRQAVR
jgi:hypothetical protein